MRFLIYGEDNFRSRRRLASVRSQFAAQRDPSGLNSVVLRAADAAWPRVSEALFASPFLAEKKLVILEHFLSAAKAELQTNLVEALTRLPETTNAVFFEEAGAAKLRRSPLFADLAKEKFSLEFPALDVGAAGQLIREECQAAGVGIEPRAAQDLIALVGVDSWSLCQEIAKLAAYVQARGAASIAPADVHELVSEAQADAFFVFLDACVSGRDRLALAALEKLFLSGMAEMQIVTLLEKHFRLLIAARDQLDRGLNDSGALASACGAHPFVAGKALVAARRFDLRTLADRHADLVEIERSLKTGGGKARALLDIFAVRLSSTCAAG
ncbi:MAG: DNA polymerase III subunit delta [Patescibacteria group bacterium]|jgi:DNA polymerase-3 subunit delta